MATVGRRGASSPRGPTRTGDQISFIHLERCTLHREDIALTAEDADGITHIPSATIGTLLLGIRRPKDMSAIAASPPPNLN